MDLLLEIVEGPGAGRKIELQGPVVIGRDHSADVVLEDGQISRRHARVTPSGSGIVVEDLESTNGTFVNHDEVHSPVELAPGDELLVGVTVMQLRSPEQVRAQASAVRAVPPGLATPEVRPAYVADEDPARVARAGQGAGIPELDRLVDARVKSKAMLAPLALFVLVALIVVIYLGLVN
jgi:pSer/pThr/pTyr-binding forkhead associated (FHA) protein